MIGALPKSLSVSGQSFAIRSDYRIALNLLDALSCDDLTNLDKAYLTVKTLYFDDIPDELFTPAVTAAYQFLDGGDIPKSKPLPVRMIDYKHDEAMLFSAVNNAAKCEVRALEYMHWWTFLSYMASSGEGLFSTVMNIRAKLAQGKRLEKHEREFIAKHKELVILRSEQEQREIEQTEEFLRTIT